MRNIILFASKPTAEKIISEIKRPGVYQFKSVEDLDNQVNPQQNQDEIKRLNSIIILVYPGDEISVLPNIYKSIQKFNVLVTTIIINKSESIALGEFQSLAFIRSASDMVIITSDDTCLEYMLDCLV
jgi:hypothetical protein